MYTNRNQNIDHLKQAFSISDEQKAEALAIYEESVSELVRRDYIAQDEDAHTDLSGIFGVKWIVRRNPGGQFWKNPQLYAEANIAFNYANCRHSKKHKFIELAKQLVNDSDRVNDETLNRIASEMNCILTNTTAADWKHLQYSN